eukprot:CAMPEP_0119484630 /NCGR_PEP_ID=MMETSP1344-20130328/11578_1 /TAXON_ID=236787 /ORGANISM="Florenciella parvula, Strain CCMP2471" /LENGTH=1104 /DNA_ID=CAMNT_0007519231 /DNA_START=22 /DNA_END=3334 /DNA_ORIENTATION=+
MAAEAKSEMPGMTHRQVLDKKVQEDPVLSGAMAKLTDAAVHYDRNRDSIIMKAFEGSSMEPHVFKMQLARAFQIRLNEKEISALVLFFDKDGDGTVDGAEFLLEFFRRGFQEQARRKKVIRDRENRKKKKEADAKAKAEAKEAEKAFSAAAQDFTEENFVSAYDKMTAAALRYEKGSPSAVSLLAFEGASMTPAVFKEQLKRVFQLNFTRQELGALIRHYDKDGDQTVDCAEFLIEFFKCGFAAKTEKQKMIRKRGEDARQRELDYERRKMEELHEHAAAKLDADFTEEDLKSCMMKITKAATWYDRNSPSAVQLDAFDGAEMVPHVFREQLKRIFYIKLTPGELGAAMHHFDQDQSGTINCSEFLTAFFKTGFKRRADILRQRRERQRAMIAAAKEEEARKLAASEAKANLQTSDQFTEEDRQRAMDQITAAAALYDRNSPGCVQLDAFDGATMAPHVFKEQLFRVFNIRLTPPELGALMKFFDKDGDGVIDCSEFLITFFKVGFEEKDKRAKAKAKLKEQKRKKEEEEKKKMEAEKLRKAMEFDRKYSEADKATAIAKIELAAYRYDKNSPGAMNLNGFQGAELTPGEFKEQLLRAFNIRLNQGELGAVMDHFDADGSGTVGTSEFLISFFKTGFEKRAAHINHLRELEKRAQRAEVERAERRQIEIEQKAKTQIATFTEADQEAVFDMLIEAAVKYDVRTIGPAGLKGFDGAVMEPTVFKEQLRRTFNIKVNPAQLGAFVKFFDLDGDNTVDCSEFLTQFFKTGLECKGILSRPNSQRELRKYKQKLKQRFLEDHHRASSRPFSQSGGRIRPATTPYATKSMAASKVFRPQRSPADTAEVKVERRLDASVRSHRLDLSTSVTKTTELDVCFLTIPELVFSMQHLTELWLSNNNLTDVPAQVQQLDSLQVLAIDGNELTSVCPELGQMPQLRRLLLGGNKLSELPAEMSGMTNLLELTLDRNSFTEFPLPVTDMVSLRRLSLANNAVTSLPTEIRKLRRLNELRLDNNPNLALPAGEARDFSKDWKIVFRDVFDLPVLAELGVSGCPKVEARRAGWGIGSSVYVEQAEELEADLYNMLKGEQGLATKAGRSRLDDRGSPVGY